MLVIGVLELCRIDFQKDRIVLEIKAAKKTLIKMGLGDLRIIHQLSDTDTVYNTGLMVLIMKDNGLITKLKVQVLSGTQRAMFIVVNSKTIWLMDTVSIRILMAQNIRENLKMMCKKVMVKKNGSMELNTLVHIRMA